MIQEQEGEVMLKVGIIYDGILYMMEYCDILNVILITLINLKRYINDNNILGIIISEPQ